MDAQVRVGHHGVITGHHSIPEGQHGVRIFLVDNVHQAGGSVSGVVRGLAAHSGPFKLVYRCEEHCLKMLFLDHKNLTELGRGSSVVRYNVLDFQEHELEADSNGYASFSFATPARAPPNFIGVHDIVHNTLVYTSSHHVTIKDIHGKSLARSVVNVVPAATQADEVSEEQVDRVAHSMRVIPRLSLRCAPLPLPSHPNHAVV